MKVFDAETLSSPSSPSIPPSCVLMFPPWDLLRGRDVFVDSEALDYETENSRLSHHAPNCATFSRAREIPIPGVKNCPKPLRSLEYPRGIPSELARLKKKDKDRLDLDTRMADLSAEKAMAAAERGDGFSLEHPLNSIAWSLESWTKLASRSDCIAIPYSTCMFEGSERRKMQQLLTNVKPLAELIGKVCKGGRVCERTGKPHKKWKPMVTGGKILSFSTGEEREYPIGFCKSYAQATLGYLKPGDAFVEVFSGPNAPLSREVAQVHGIDLPGFRVSKSGKGVKNELQKLSDLRPDKPPPLKETVEYTFSRLSALEAGKQPSYGKRVQLIDDGINDEIVHLNLAKDLSHPFNTLSVLKDDHLEALEHSGTDCRGANMQRLKTLAKWKELAGSDRVKDLQAAHHKRASVAAKKLGLKPRTGLMSVLGSLYHVEDKAVPELCVTGMPIVGKALTSPFFYPYEVPARLTLSELLSKVASQRSSLMKRVARMASAESPQLQEAIWRKTMKEVEQGTMEGPLSPSAVEERWGKYYNVVPSFGLQQGDKFRRIDDHSACLNNAAGTRTQRIEMATVDYVVVLIKSLAERVGTRIHTSTEDMQGAYRQIPLCDSQIPLAITAVYSPVDKESKLFALYGQPFGAAHAVPNFYRVSEYLSRLVGRAYKLLLDHFFDDFFLVTQEKESQVSAFCLNESFKLLGFTLDPEKTQVPSEVSNILGVVFNTAALITEKKLWLQPKPSRKTNIVTLIDKVVQDNHLPPSLAASLVGKFGFLCSTLFGKIGRCCTGALRARQYSTSGDCSLDWHLRISLSLMRFFILQAPERHFSLRKKESPMLLYTDASDVPGRPEGQYILGAVLIDPHQDYSIRYTYWVVPPSIVQKWITKATYMNQLEILAGPLALQTWSKQLATKQIIHFVDNDAAASSLVKGYSQKSDSCALTGSYWILAAKLALESYIDRVESKSNLADGPSRLNFDTMASLQASFTEPIIDSLGAIFSEISNFF